MALLETLHIETHDYTFQQLRDMVEKLAGGAQEGVYGAGDYLVGQRAAGANLSVDVAAGSAFVKMDTGTRNGFYYQVNDGVVNVPVGAAHATLPRIDQVYLQINDSNVVGGTDVATLGVLAGTATSGAQASDPAAANYRAGATALGNDRIRLADITVPAAAASIVAANITDRRPWARGAYRRITRRSNAAAGQGYVASTTNADIDATNLKPAVEFSGAPVRVHLLGGCIGSVAGQTMNYDLFMDGAALDGSVKHPHTFAAALYQHSPLLLAEFTPPAGRHVIAPRHQASTGAPTTLAQADIPLTLVIEELVRQNSGN